MITPHHKDNLKPLGSQSPQRSMVTMSFSPLVTIVMIGPLTSIERDKGQPVGGVAQDLVTTETKLDHAALTAGLGHRHYTRLGLQVTKRLPAILSIAELGPQCGHDRARLGSRQQSHQLSRRHGGEKTSDPLVVALNRIAQSDQLSHQHLQQPRLGSHHVLGNLKLRLLELVPQLFRALLSKRMLALGKAIPLPASQSRKSLRCWVLFEKIQREVRFQIRKHLQRPRIVLFECGRELVEQPGLLTDQPLLIAREQFKLLGHIGVGLERSQNDHDRFSQTPPIRRRQRNHFWTDSCENGPAPDPAPWGSPHRPPPRGPKENPRFVPEASRWPPKAPLPSSALIEKTTKLSQPPNALLNLFLAYLLALRIADPDLVKLIGPIDSQIISLQWLLLLAVVPIPSALNGMFALYRSSTKGPLSIESQLRSLTGGTVSPGSSNEMGEGGSSSSKLLKLVSRKHDLQYECLQQS